MEEIEAKGVSGEETADTGKKRVEDGNYEPAHPIS